VPSIVAGLAAAVLLSQMLAPAAHLLSTESDLADPVSMMSSVQIPELEEVVHDPTAEMSVDSSQGAAVVTLAHVVDQAEVATGAQSGAPEVEPPTPVSIGLPAAVQPQGETDGFLVATSEDGTHAAYVRATVDGGQATFAADDPVAASGDHFRITLPAGIAEVESLPDGLTGLILESGDSIVLHPAWAVDANSEPLATSYEITGSTIT